MLNKLNSRQGFTLIELLIVVAIIGILAAIAIPQFSAYQRRGYASSVRSDARNLHTSIRAAFADKADATTLVSTGVAAGTYTASALPPAPIANVKISTGVTLIVAAGATDNEDNYTIEGRHGKLNSSATSNYILYGSGAITDNLSAGF